MSIVTGFAQEHIVTKSSSSEDLKPLPFLGSLLLFGLPAIIMVASYHLFMPWLTKMGLDAIESFVVAHIAPLSVMLAVSLAIFHRLEGQPLTWHAFSRRFRYPRLTGKIFLLGLGTFVALNLAYGVFTQLGNAIAGQSLATEYGVVRSIEQLLNESLQGRWEIIPPFILLLLVNVIGEELWWRGVILPRQELVHGNHTWIVHGLLWTAFHAFKWWDLIGLLPVCLIIAAVSQKAKNNWPALIAHFLFNGMALALVVKVVTG